VSRKDPKAILEQLKARQTDIRDAMPDVMKGFAAMMQGATKDGVLSHKVKELITLAIAIAERCDYCIAAHVVACLKAGATREEIMEVCGVCIFMGGGPSYTYTALVIDALDAFEAK
jgi:AhpD family alkylhydroperoxidase